ncbi:cohesin domain-containing protein [Marinicrinis lubricantis]|uniref:Cohesin domain-containing protein n=1 Tax=Marinicrinis lubricantis TaxID=2086470 RepID=A0ABW1IRJ5_9BACL
MGLMRRSKRFCIWLMMLSIVITLIPTGMKAKASSAEPIPVTLINAGFEESENGIPAGWSYWKSGNLSGMSVSDTVYAEGSSSLKLDVREASTLGVESTPFAVLGGETYSVTASVYVEQINRESSSAGVNLWMRFFAADGSHLSDLRTKVKASEVAEGEWFQVTATGPAPEEAVNAIVFPYVDRYTDFIGYYDDTRVDRWAEQTGLQNPDFEQSSADGRIPGWSLYPDPLREGTAITLTEDIAASGAKSVRFDDQNSGASMGLRSVNLDVTPGQSYAATVRTYIETGASGLYIKFYNDAGTEVGSSSQGVSDPKGQWVELRTEAIAPETAVRAQVWLYSGGATVGTVYFDDVRFEELQVLELPYEYAKPVSLGDATVVAKTQGGAVGNGEIYFGASGSPAAFFAIDALTGEVNFRQELPNHDVVWAVTIGSDNNVYIGGTQTGILFRYLPQEKKLENLGVNPSNRWIWDLDASSDGKIYGSTYPDSKAFVYDIETDTFTDMGTIHPGQDYVRGSGVTDQYFYAGIGTTAYLYRFDRETGEKSEIPLPITGTSTSVSNIWSHGGKLFIAYGTSLLVIDEQTYEVRKQLDWQDPNTFDGQISAPSPHDSNLIYFRNKNTSQLWTYHLETDEISLAEPELYLPNVSLKAMNWVELTEGEKAGRHVLVMLSAEIDQMIYDPVEHTLDVIRPDVLKSGIDIQSLETGPDGNLYMGGYQGAMSVYDTSKGEFVLQEKEPHQIEGIGFLNGKVYFGIYGGAVISEFDPTKPFEMGANPRTVYDIQDDQSRPFTFTSGEGKLFVGTVADYGYLGGALTIYDQAADTWSVHQNVVQNQSVIGLAYDQGKVYGGTSIWGGLGIDPSETEAKLFEWDVAAASKTAEFVPEVPGFVSPQMIGELSIGPDGNLWGIMWGTTKDASSGFALFALDLETKEVVKSKVLTTGERASSWRPFFMRWGDDGLLYTTIGRQLIAFDPETLASKQLVNEYVHLMTLGEDGSIYYAQGAELMRIPVRMEGASLSAGHRVLETGQETDLDITLQFVNGKTGHADGHHIAYQISDPSVVEIVDGKLIALKEGAASITATVTQDTVQKTTNTVMITVDDRSPGELQLHAPTSVLRGSTFEAVLQVAGANQLYAADAVIHYDPNMLELVSDPASSTFRDHYFTYDISTPGVIRMIASAVGDHAFDGSVEVAALSFKAADEISATMLRLDAASELAGADADTSGKTYPLGHDVKLVIQITNIAEDVDQNGIVNLVDLIAVAKKVGQPVTEENRRFDVNGDGFIDIMDVSLVAHYLLGHS